MRANAKTKPQISCGTLLSPTNACGSKLCNGASCAVSSEKLLIRYTCATRVNMAVDLASKFCGPSLRPHDVTGSRYLPSMHCRLVSSGCFRVFAVLLPCSLAYESQGEKI